jgi:hypothetical protein
VTLCERGIGRMERQRSFIIIAVIILFVVFPGVAASAEEDFLKRDKQQDIALVSGGVGEREREVLGEIGKDYALKLIFSNEKGEYLSDVKVKMYDDKGKPIVETVSDGPWVFVDLPSGNYRLETSFKTEQKRISTIDIGKDTQKVISVQFSIKW